MPWAAWIALAFLVGAVLPALGIIAGAAVVGYWLGTRGQRPHTLASQDLLDEVNSEAAKHPRKRLR